MADLSFEMQKMKINLEKLFKAYEKLSEENKRLKQQNEAYTSEMSEARKKNEDLANKNINLQLTRSIGKGTAENESLKRKLDALISDIDSCIAFLDS